MSGSLGDIIELLNFKVEKNQYHLVVGKKLESGAWHLIGTLSIYVYMCTYMTVCVRTQVPGILYLLSCIFTKIIYLYVYVS